MAPTSPHLSPARAPKAGIFRKWVLGGALLALVLGTMAGCDTSDPQVPGAVQGRVTGEGAPLPGVTVELTGPVNRVSQSDADGRFAFSEVPVGAYVVSIRDLPADAAFPAISRTATVTAGSTLNVDFQGNYIRTASISGSVRARDQGVAGVTVRLAGPDEATTVTSGDGTFTFSALRSGGYEVEISGYPQNIAFPSTRTTVALQPGQSHQATFEGIPDVTATVAIAGVQRVLDDGTLLPADPTSLEGRIQVGIVLDRGEDTPDSLVVSLGSEVVARQRFTESEAAAVSQPVALSFTIDTRAWDPQTGATRFRNGEILLTARLATREGGPSAALASAQLRLVNRDSLVATVHPSRGPEPSPTGEPWVGGDLTVRVLPLLYTPGRTLSTLTLDLRTAQGELVARKSVVGEAPFEVAFPAAPALPGSLAGHLTGAGPGDRFVVSTARYGDGAFFPGLPFAVGDPVRVDQRPPSAEGFRLPRQMGVVTCCLDNWVGAAFPFAQALEGASDPGVGRLTATFHAGPASLGDSELAELDPVTHAGALAPTAGNQAYRAVARLEDALGNVRILPLEPSSGNPVAVPGGAAFGVDTSPPSLRLATGGSTLGPRTVNPPPGSAWAFVGEDGEPSGFGPLPLLATVRRFAPGDPAQGRCLLPSGENEDCTPSLGGWAVAVPASGVAGYLQVEARAVDRGGNLSSPQGAWVLVDDAPPELSAFFLQAPPVVGSPVGVGLEARDNVDLDRARVYLRAGAGGEVPLLPAPRAPVLLGTPWTGARQPEAAAQFDLPHILAVQHAAGGGQGNGAAGPLHPVTALEARAWDAAGLAATRTLTLPSPPSGSLAGFDAAARGAGGAVTGWTLEGSAGSVCREGSTCGGGTPTSVTFHAVAVWGSADAPLPFERVHLLVLNGSTGAAAPGWVGTVSSATPEPGVAAGARWSYTWTPPAGTAPGSWQVVALGVDAAGNALLVAEPVTVEVRAAP